ncbi:MAG: YIP1 family protein [Acidobacteriaceae bacterium]|nr:YIP1 family protein [Acidobacteriaceae bacterium]
MSTLVPDLPLEPHESFADDLVGMGSFFIDPEGAAKRAFHKWFWIGPLIVVSIIAIATQLVRLPITQEVMQTMQLPNGVTEQQWEKQMQISLMIQHIAVWVSPIIVIVLYAFQAVVLLAMCSILTVNAKYRTLFNIVAGCSLISSLEAIASVIVLKMKAPVSTIAELKPPLGLDIFLSEGSNKFLMGFLSYFTIFNLWWIIMIVLVLAAAFRITKGKAFAIVLPVILISLVLIMAGAAFTPRS